MTTYASKRDPHYASKTARGCEAAGEPVFLLRAQDIMASEVVRDWAERVKAERPELAAEATRISDRMRAWPDQKFPG